MSLKCKIPEFHVELERTAPDIVIGIETWLNDNTKNKEILPNHYEVFRGGRTNGYGGVLLAIKEELDPTEINITLKLYLQR